MQKGNIGVTTENIFPVIKKFLYSDHEIFLRELVSNAVDATQKLKTLASMGDFKGELGDLTIHVSVDKDTITVSDRGLGLTAEEIDKYINQIAFSGANDFLEKYKNDANAIIGHFGLGFYSAFMVAKKVEIITKSYQEGAQAVKWTCDGSPEFTIEDVDKADRGTDIVLYVDDDCKEFLEETRISALLKKYCRFLPVPVAFGKKKEWKDGKQVETGEDNVINDTTPLWTRKPSELKDEDYKKFYSELYPMADEPLFWIHLNVDYPFHLTGILYFPKVKSNIELNKNKIQLYCNQVYVTDSVEGIVTFFKREFGKVPHWGEMNPFGVRPDKRQAFDAIYRDSLQDIRNASDYEALSADLFASDPFVERVWSYIKRKSGNVYLYYDELFRDADGAKKMATGTCIPFSRKLFVTVNGKILPCEKINHTFSYGCVNRNTFEFSLEKVADQFNEYITKLVTQCCQCAIRYECSLCLYNIMPVDDGEFHCNCRVLEGKPCGRWRRSKEYIVKHPWLYKRLLTKVYAK